MAEKAAEWAALTALKPWSANPRKNADNVARVAASIKRFGFAAPIVARKADGEIIAGHTRYLAAQSLGLAQVPVRYLDLDPADAHLLALADNRLNELSPWDDAALQSILSEYGLESAALAGWSSDDLEKMADELLADSGSLVEGDVVPEPPRVAVTKPGDVWILGDHRLACCDSTDLASVRGMLGGRGVDMLLSDPLYGVSYVGKTADAMVIENDALDETALTALIAGAFDVAQSVSREGAYWYATVPAGPLHILFADDWKRRGILRQILVWDKCTLVLGHSEYHYQHEPILFGWVPGGSRHKNADRTRTSVWSVPKPASNRVHPTMKPVELWARAITDGSRQGELVYDPFLGSGTSIVAAAQLGRHCYGCELSPHYCDVIVERWEQLSGGKAVRQ